MTTEQVYFEQFDGEFVVDQVIEDIKLKLADYFPNCPVTVKETYGYECGTFWEWTLMVHVGLMSVDEAEGILRECALGWLHDYRQRANFLVDVDLEFSEHDLLWCATD